jgi:hypothetical protein
MKSIMTVRLVFAMLLGILTLAGCNPTPEILKIPETP